MVAVKLTDAEIRANLDAVLLTNELGGKWNSGDTILNYLTADVFDCTLG